MFLMSITVVPFSICFDINIAIRMLGAPTWQFEERAVYDVVDADHLL